jgi:hypothetical protein
MGKQGVDMQNLRKHLTGNKSLAWMVLAAWLIYSVGALWALEKDKVRVGKVCAVAKR